MAVRGKENLPGGSLKYRFVYLKIRIFKCSYRTTNNDYNDAATLPLTTEAGFRGVFVGALVLPV